MDLSWLVVLIVVGGFVYLGWRWMKKDPHPPENGTYYPPEDGGDGKHPSK